MPETPQKKRKDRGQPLQTGFIMDPISKIKIHKDSTFAMMLEAQRRGHVMWYIEPGDLHIRDTQPVANMARVKVCDSADGWYSLEPAELRPLTDLDILLMRRDPPFDMDYVYATYILDLAESADVAVVNAPQALRDANEKCFITRFPQCTVPMLVSRNAGMIKEFVQQNGLCVVKPLDGMGGTSIFQARADDPNLNVILETITDGGRELIMAQKYIPEITEGDKRILLVDGEPVPYALARVPGQGDFRGNLAKGGSGHGVALSDRDRWICEQVAPELRRRGIVFAGLDVIGDYLTEVNVTSPTCIRELDAEYGLNIAGQMFDVIEAGLAEEG